MKLGHHQNQNSWFSKNNVKKMKGKQEIRRKYMQTIYTSNKGPVSGLYKDFL